MELCPNCGAHLEPLEAERDALREERDNWKAVAELLQRDINDEAASLSERPE